MRDNLIDQYYRLNHKRSDIVNPQACGIRKELLTRSDVLELDKQIKDVLDQLALPANRVQPKDEHEREHGIWLLVAMPEDGYLPGELIRIRNSASFYDGKIVQRALLCESVNRNKRTIVLLLDPDKPYCILGAEAVKPSPFCM